MYRIHFLNVGHGDCVIVHFPERYRKSDDHKKDERIMMIDINQMEDLDTYEDIIQYYKDNLPDGNGGYKSIFRFVCTHPHKDHITGLNDLFNDNNISILNFWDIDNKFQPEEFEDNNHADDWNKYEELKKSTTSPKCIVTDRQDPPRKYWDDDEDRITVISPSREIIEDVHSSKQDGSKRQPHEIEIDEISYSLLFKFNNIKLYLAGDGKEKCLNDIYDNCLSDLNNINILRAGHHGQESAFHEDLTKEMNPAYIIFSNSESEDGDQGAANLYSQALDDPIILKTCDHGTIILNIDFNNNYYFEDSNGNRL